MEKVKQRKFLSKTEIKELIKKASQDNFLNKVKVKKIEALKLKDGSFLYLLDNKPLLASKYDKLFPTLFNKKKNEISFFIIDEGAISYILNGADIMAPGIISFPKKIIEKQIVAIKTTSDEIIAIGFVLDNFKEKLQLKKGKVIKNLHYKGDQIFNLSLFLLRKIMKLF